MAMDGCERKVPLEWPLLRMFVDRGGRGWTASWRKGWDSNPRGRCRPGGFQDRCLKPLGHPSTCSARRAAGGSRGARCPLQPVAGERAHEQLGLAEARLEVAAVPAPPGAIEVRHDDLDHHDLVLR